MGTDVGALVALDAFVHLPFGDGDGDAAFFKGAGACGEGAVFHAAEGADGEFVSFLAVHGDEDVVDEGGGLGHHADAAEAAGALEFGLVGFGVRGGFPGFRYGDGDEGADALVDGGVVHVDDFLAFVAVGVDDGVFEVGDGFFDGDDIGEFEEGGLHDHVESSAEAEFLGDGDGVDDVEFDVVVGDGPFHGAGEFGIQFIGGPGGVEEEGAAWLEAGEDVVFVDVGLLRTGYEVGFVDEVGGFDGLTAKAQVGYGDAA